MNRLKTEWAEMSTAKKGLFGVLLAAGLIFLALSTTGAIDLFAVQTGVTPTE